MSIGAGVGAGIQNSPSNQTNPWKDKDDFLREAVNNKEAWDAIAQRIQSQFPGFKTTEILCKERFFNFADPTLDHTDLKDWEKRSLNALMKKHGAKIIEILNEFHQEKLARSEGRRSNLLLKEYIGKSFRETMAHSETDHSAGSSSMQAKPEVDSENEYNSEEEDLVVRKRRWDERELSGLNDALKIFKKNECEKISKFLEKEKNVFMTARQCHKKISLLNVKKGELDKEEEKLLEKLSKEYPGRFAKIGKIMQRSDNSIKKLIISRFNKREREEEIERLTKIKNSTTASKTESVSQKSITKKDSSKTDSSKKRKTPPNGANERPKKKFKTEIGARNKSEKGAGSKPEKERKRIAWKQYEIDALLEETERLGEGDWVAVSVALEKRGITKDRLQCINRYKHCKAQHSNKLSEEDTEKLDKLLADAGDSPKYKEIGDEIGRTSHFVSSYLGAKKDKASYKSKAKKDSTFKKWTPDEDKALLAAYKIYGDKKWTPISKHLKEKYKIDKDNSNCKRRHIRLTTDQSDLSPEDSIKLEHILDTQPHNWTLIGATFNRSGKWVQLFSEKYERRKANKAPDISKISSSSKKTEQAGQTILKKGTDDKVKKSVGAGAGSGSSVIVKKEKEKNIFSQKPQAMDIEDLLDKALDIEPFDDVRERDPKSGLKLLRKKPKAVPAQTATQPQAVSLPQASSDSVPMNTEEDDSINIMS
ncbi:MAG: SANT/Myb domain-containing protein [Parachlamydiaceae bacterium]|nr:SANT/Myb domain-containing protein [Parachlamydiaceae bacterium]